MMRPITFEGPNLLALPLTAMLQQVCLSIPQYIMKKHPPDARNYNFGAK